MSNTLTISIENLAHFQCPHCKGWWSVGDAPNREYWFCPWCGVKCLVGSDASSLRGKYKFARTSSEEFAARKQSEIELEGQQEKPQEGAEVREG